MGPTADSFVDRAICSGFVGRKFLACSLNAGAARVGEVRLEVKKNATKTIADSREAIANSQVEREIGVQESRLLDESRYKSTHAL